MKKLVGFWSNGLSLAECIAVIFTITANVGYIMFESMDTNFADIVIASIFIATCGRVAPEIINKRGSRNVTTEVEEVG